VRLCRDLSFRTHNQAFYFVTYKFLKYNARRDFVRPIFKNVSK